MRPGQAFYSTASASSANHTDDGHPGARVLRQNLLFSCQLLLKILGLRKLRTRSAA